LPVAARSPITAFTPRTALERLRPEDHPAWSAEVADLAGDRRLGDRLRAGVNLFHAPQEALRAFRRREDDEGLVRFAIECAASEEAVLLDASDRESLREAAADAGRRLGREVEIVFPGRDPVAKIEPVRAAAKIGRNDPCPCGSGRKYKKCCGLSPP
jgi:hypothetical protein